MQRRDGRGTGIVGIGLAGLSTREQPHPSRQRRGHVDHGLTGLDQLLRKQPPQALRALDREPSPGPLLREREQQCQLPPISSDAKLVEQLALVVDRDRGVRALGGSIPIMTSIATASLSPDGHGQPQRTVLM